MESIQEPLPSQHEPFTSVSPDWEGEIDLRALFDLLRRSWYLLLLGLFFGALGGYVASRLQTPLYEAKTQVLVTRVSGGSSDVLDFTQAASLRELTATYRDLLSQDWVRDEVTHRLGMEELPKDRVKVSQTTNALVINIAALDPDPYRAAQIADTLVQVLIEQNEKIQASRYDEAEHRLEKQIAEAQARIAAVRSRLEANRADPGADQDLIQLESELSLYQQMYLDLLDKRETLRLQKAQSMPNVIQVTPAIPSEEPVRPRTLLNTLLASVLGLGVAVGGVLLREALDTSVRDAEQVEQMFGLPVVAQIPWHEEDVPEKALAAIYRPRSPKAEAFRLLRTNLDFVALGHPLRVIVVTSPGPEEGKTTTVINLGAVLSQASKEVVLVDADLRKPRLHRYLNIPNRLGMTDLFRGRVSLSQVLQRVRLGRTTFHVLTSGGLPPNPAELVGSERMQQLLTTLQERFDVVLVDVPPGLVADGQILAARADGLLIVVRPGATPLDALRALIEQHRRSGSRILGVVFNGVSRRNGMGYSYYYYAYGYTYGAEEGQASEPGAERERRS